MENNVAFCQARGPTIATQAWARGPTIAIQAWALHSSHNLNLGNV